MKRKLRLNGFFELSNAQQAHGELLIKGRKSLLTLTSQSKLPSLSEENVMYGKTVDGQKVSCISCVTLSQGDNWSDNEFTHHLAHVFPHFVTVGHEHLDPVLPVVHGIEFTVDDLQYLFYDFDAFGSVFAANDIIGQVLDAKNLKRPVEIGEHPMVAYFAGKLTVIEVKTDIGKMIVWRRIAHNTGGPKGVFMKNRMVVSLEMGPPVTFENAIDRMRIITRFLSLMAGRRQIAYDIHLRTSAYTDKSSKSTQVYWTTPPKSYKSQNEGLTPDIRSIPINPIQNPDEFSIVFKDWVRRDAKWQVPRIRYEDCLSNGNYYDTNRLIAAANMFDILPENAVPQNITLPDDLADSRDECVKILNSHPKSDVRDRAIQALKRMEKASLRRKISYHAEKVKTSFQPLLNEMEFVIRLSVKCRNYFVHGDDNKFDFRTVEPFLPFLTDTLEFIFAASDLIEGGWGASKWMKRAFLSSGHSFARFIDQYHTALTELKLAMDLSPKN
ncbi:MAG: hypothetical protein MI685_02710 [Chlorobiales bacterium]|nr:hypothetical protein [Chlorobiales bacterium]